tara:strand:+ start:467 stop:739 length:273 start_codon:yes stop_codon:yes gene_type:complete
MTNIYSKRNIKMKESIKQTNEAINEFLGETQNPISDEFTAKCINPDTGEIDQECKLKSKDGLIESTKVINKKVIVSDGRELLREITFKHE